MLVLSACAGKMEIPRPEGMKMTITAYQEGSDLTRTTVQNGGTQVYWEPSDEIKVFFSGSGARFVSQNTENATVATFSGTINVVAGANEGAGSSNQIWGLFPYRDDSVCDGSSVTTTLPGGQVGRPGCFAKNAHITLARSGGLDLAFYNVSGGLRFSLTQTGIKRVTLEGIGGEAIAGRIKITFADGIPVVEDVSEGETKITLSVPDGGTFQTGRWYYLSALPVSLSKGFRMTFYRDLEVATFESTSPVSIKRGIYGSIAEVDKGLTFSDYIDGIPDLNAFIQFADPIAKSACVEKFDTNGDGELSYAEAAKVTSLQGLFTNWKTVTSFEEIRYFIRVTSVQSVFTNLTELTHITLPDHIKSIGSSCFFGCTSLKTVVLPKGLTTLPTGCFKNCGSLASITWPETLSRIEDYVFDGCLFENVGHTLDLPPTVTYIGNNAIDQIHHLIIRSPSITTDLSPFRGYKYTYIYVPADLVSQYKNSFLYRYKEMVYPIESYPIRESVGGMVGEAVDLGLSVKWASWNVGASSPEEYGSYFAWGETEDNWNFDMLTYKWTNDDGETMTKYNTDPNCGPVDNKTVLEPEDDAAHVHWGEGWRMPTFEEFQELVQNCSVTYVTDASGIKIGCRFSGKKEGYTDRSIYLPCAQLHSGYSFSEGAFYWTSSLYYGWYAKSFELGTGYFSSYSFRENTFRSEGLSIRPVCD